MFFHLRNSISFLPGKKSEVARAAAATCGVFFSISHLPHVRVELKEGGGGEGRGKDRRLQEKEGKPIHFN